MTSPSIDLADIVDRYLAAKSGGDGLAWQAKLWALLENKKLAGKQRDPARLFVTDVGKCLRQVKYRLNGEPRRPITPARRMMFEQAEDIETTIAAAMKWEGVLLDYQRGVDVSDRENWGGRKDVTVSGPLTVEVKSSRSNAFKGDKGMPKPDHITQGSIYNHYDDIPVVLLYVDRGGENQMRQYAVPVADWSQVAPCMDALDRAREDAALPDCLPPVLTRKAVRASRIDLGGLVVDWSGEVWIGPDWRCRYCEYDACPGKRHESHLLAKMTKKVPIDLTREGRRHEDDVYDYLRRGEREMSLA